MRESRKEYKTIDEFIGQFPADVQKILQELRSVIRETAPSNRSHFLRYSHVQTPWQPGAFFSIQAPHRLLSDLQRY